MTGQTFQQPPEKQQRLMFPVHISHGLRPGDGNIIILTKYFALYEHTKSLCGILPPGLAHPLLPKNVYMMLQSP